MSYASIATPEDRLTRIERLMENLKRQQRAVYQRTYARTVRRAAIEQRILTRARQFLKRLEDGRFILAKKGTKGLIYFTPTEQQKLLRLLRRDWRTGKSPRDKSEFYKP